MPRSMPIDIYNPVNGQNDVALKPFYPRQIYSTWAIATGDSSFTPFNNVEAAALRNYQKGQNIFEQNQGRAIYLWGDFTGAAGVGFLPITGVATATVLDAYKLWYNGARLDITQDSQITEKCLLAGLFPAPPMYTVATTSGAPLIAWENNPGGGTTNQSTRRGKYFTPPIFVGNGRSLDFRVSMPDAYTAPAALNTLRAIFYLDLEELVPGNPSPVRQ